MTLPERLSCSLLAVALCGIAGAEEPPVEKTLRSWGLSDAEIARYRAMMAVSVHEADPAAILAMRERLALKEEQVHRLGVLQEKARADALAVLTDEQRKKVEALPDEPRTMADLRRDLTRRMRKAEPQAEPCDLCRLDAAG